jgi:hypothetical protein
MGQNDASIFNPKKYPLIQFVNIQEVDPQYTPRSLQEHTVATSWARERYLGH